MNGLITTLAEMRSSVWAIVPEHLDRLLLQAAAKEANLYRTSTPDLTTRGDPEPRAITAKRSPSVRGTIGVLPLRGVITQRGFGGLMAFLFGEGASTEAYGQAFDALIADDQVGAVVLDIDSPGGMHWGTPELHAKIRAGREIKPVVAVANSLAASAAYYIASAASQVVMTPSGQVGSIGVFRTHVDTTAAEEAEGVKVTHIIAGKYKAEGLLPLTPEAEAAMQQEVDTCLDQFIADVAKGRGVSASVVRKTYGEGRVVLAKDALAAGMVDRIATLEEVLSGMQASGRSSGRGKTVRTMAITPELCAAIASGFYGVDSRKLPGDARVVAARCTERPEGIFKIEIDLESAEFTAETPNPLSPKIRSYYVKESSTALAGSLLGALSESDDMAVFHDQPKLRAALEAALVESRLREPGETPRGDRADQRLRLMEMEQGDADGVSG